MVQSVPLFTLVSFLGSHRLLQQQQQQAQAETNKSSQEEPAVVSANRVAMGANKSHLVELMQTARMELESSPKQIPETELLQCVQPVRILPERVECMLASPDASIMWDRWEWLRRTTKQGEAEEEWCHPQQLVPH